MNRLLLALLLTVVASSALAETKEEEAVRYLGTMIVSVREENDPMRNRMFIKLRVVGDPAVGPLLGALEDPDPAVRHYLAFTLGFFDDPRVTEPLLGLFRSDGDIDVRCAAAEALGRRETMEAVDPLLQALGESDPRVRQSSAYALGLIGDSRARESLEKAKGDSDELVRFFAEEALVQIDRALARRNR
ncbi:MAG: HEAT repeat domain-containing protein [Candidatus Eisenbacteria bacterium]